LATSDRSNRILLWDLQTGEKIGAIGKFSWAVGHLHFSPDGAYLAGSGHCNDCGARIWEWRTNKEVFRHVSDEGAFWMHAALSSDGETLATHGRTLRFWDVKTGKERSSVATKLEGGMSAGVFSPDSKMFAYSGYSHFRDVALVDVASGKERFRIKKNDTDTSTLAFSPNGKILASGTSQWIQLWDVETGKELTSLPGHGDTVWTAAFAPDGKTIATTGDKTVRFWDPRTGRELRRLNLDNFSNALAFSADAKYIAVGSGYPRVSGDENTLTLFEVKTGKKQFQFGRGLHLGTFDRVAFSMSGKFLVSAHNPGAPRLWRLDRDPQSTRLPWQHYSSHAAAIS